MPADARECRDQIERGDAYGWFIGQYLPTVDGACLARPVGVTQTNLRPYRRPGEQAAFPD